VTQSPETDHAASNSLAELLIEATTPPCRQRVDDLLPALSCPQTLRHHLVEVI
jgi:hypothetical protein